MDVSRRTLLGSVAASALMLNAYKANAILSSGAGGTSSQLSSFTVVETSGINQPSGFIPQMVGLPFKKGDIASGTWPSFKMHSGGQAVPFSMPSGLSTIWSDGSLKHATFLFRMPVALNANQSAQIDIYNGGGKPGSSFRTTADFSAGGTSLEMHVTGMDNLNGDWVSYLNHGISNTNQSGGASNILDYGDGPVGRVWRIKASFEQSNAAHGQLEGFWYVASLQDASGGLYGIRLLGAIAQPWYGDSHGTKIYRSFSAMMLQNGATVLRDLIANMPSPKSSTFSNGSFLTAPSHGFYMAMATRVSGGTIPNNLQTDKTYFMRRQGNDTFSFCSDSVCYQNVAAQTNAGTTTVSVYPYICFGGRLYFAGANAIWDYVQGNGSWAPAATLADHTTRVTFDKVYFRQSRLMPAWDSTMKTNTYFRENYIPGCIPGTYPSQDGLEQDQGSSGEGAGRALLHSASVQHWINQDANTEQFNRLIGLVGGALVVHLFDFATVSPPVANNTDYSGMPAHNNAFMWKFDQPHTVGFTIPNNPNVALQQFNFTDTGHFTDQSYYQFLFTGEPQYNDHLQAFANWTLMQSFGGTPGAPRIDSTHFNMATPCFRNVTIGGTTYYGTTNLIPGAGRVSAWATRCVAGAAALVPDTDPAKPYFVDLNSTNWAASQALAAIIPKWGHDRGAWPTTVNDSALWTGYQIQVACFAAAVTESSDALAQAAYLVKWPAYKRNTFSAWHVSDYGAYFKRNEPSPGSSDGGLMTDDSTWGIQCAMINWDSDTNLFTMTEIQSVEAYQIADGQRVTFFPLDAGGLRQPGGTNWFTAYYQTKCNVGAGTFQLCTDPNNPSGTLITLTDSYSDNPGRFLMEGLYNNPAANTGANANGPSTYNQNILGALRYAQALGVIVDSGLVTDMQKIANHYSYNFVNSPQFNYSNVAV